MTVSLVIILLFRNLDSRSSKFLGCEVANSVLSHLNGTNKHENLSVELKEFDDKERSILKYISGYMFKTLYCRLRKSSRHQTDINISHMNIFLAGKADYESSSDGDKFINAKNRGGLWKVTPGVF